MTTPIQTLSASSQVTQTKSFLLESLGEFRARLLQTPLLLGWLILGPLVALYQAGLTGLAYGLINLALIGIYALTIRFFTRNQPSPEALKRPTLELVLALGLLILFITVQILDFDLVSLLPFSGWVKTVTGQLYSLTAGADWLPGWARQDVFLAASSTLKHLIPTLLMFLLLGYGRKAMGLTRPHWRLTAVLVGSAAVFGLLTGILTRAPIIQVLALTAIGIFVNALPEELFYRGLLLPRLEKAFRNPFNALVVSALLFNAAHIPAALANGAAPLDAFLDVISIGYPSGLIWGYLYLRTRSVLPGMFWHAANGNLGFLMMSL